MRRLIITIAAAVGLVLAGAGITYAATTSGVINGCVVGSSRTLEHVNTFTKAPKCPKGATALSWNAQPPAASITLKYVTATSTTTNTAIAVCTGTAQRVIGGGFTIAPNSKYVVLQSHPDTVNGATTLNAWEVVAANNGSTGEPVSAYAVCAK